MTVATLMQNTLEAAEAADLAVLSLSITPADDPHLCERMLIGADALFRSGRTEEALAQLSARRHALEELERDRVGLAPAAAALLAARDRFDSGILGHDQVKSSSDEADVRIDPGCFGNDGLNPGM